MSSVKVTLPLVFYLIRKTSYSFLNSTQNISFYRRKYFSNTTTTSINKKSGYQLSSQFLEIDLPLSDKKPHSLKLNKMWLRDHCRCPKCYNSVTSQRIFDFLDLTSSNTCVVNLNIDGENIQIKWSDGHESTYNINWLFNNIYAEDKKESNNKILWNKSIADNLDLRPINNHQLLNEDETLFEVYRRVLTYGFARIDQVPATLEDTERLCRRVCRITSTLFGGSMWETGSGFVHKDTGYLNGQLEVHTDNTYFNEAQGYLVFHCTRYEGTGAESVLVDGFHVAQQLRLSDEQAYEYLSTVTSEAEYIEPGEHFKAYGPCFRHHPVTGHLEQIRFNLLDRAPISSIPQSEVGEYYQHLRALASIIRSPENEYWLHLTPGTVMIIDNWRLLHGRNSYRGTRVLNGCYFNRSDFMSRVRHHGII